MSKDPDLEHWLALSTLRVSPAVLTRLLGHFGSPRALLEAAAGGRAALPLSGGPLGPALREGPRADALRAARRWLEQPDHFALSLDDDRYPPRLREIACPPPVLYVAGDPSLLCAPLLAIVGSRRPTSGGVRNARTLAAELSAAGLVVASGLASGIDTAAHRGALEVAAPTVAVAARGLDDVYPRMNRELGARIAANGALVSEFPPGTPPLRGHFPRRNRVIAGLSLGVVVVEAGLRSGSLITARLAAEENREVFAVPGSIHSPVSRGSHQLIRDGAALVEGANDVLRELAHLPEAVSRGRDIAAAPPPADHPDHLRGADAVTLHVLATMGYEPVTIDDLVQASGLTPDRVSSILFTLELHGIVEPCPGGSFLRIA